MPFDGTSTKGGKAVLMIDLMLQEFGKNGEGWVCGHWNRGNARCLVSEMRSIRLRNKDLFTGAGTGDYILEAIGQLHGTQAKRDGIIQFNDEIAKYRFAVVKEVLGKARELAEQDI